MSPKLFISLILLAWLAWVGFAGSFYAHTYALFS